MHVNCDSIKINSPFLVSFKSVITDWSEAESKNPSLRQRKKIEISSIEDINDTIVQINAFMVNNMYRFYGNAELKGDTVELYWWFDKDHPIPMALAKVTLQFRVKLENSKRFKYNLKFVNCE
jgi:hypothetical protein